MSARRSGERQAGGGNVERVPLRTIAAQWGRIGCIGFGGPPAHISLLRKLCVTGRGWLSATEFEDGVAAANLLPGPASTQLAIFCAWRLAGPAGAVVGGVCFILPGLSVILGLAALFLASKPPLWVSRRVCRSWGSRACRGRRCSDQPDAGQLAPGSPGRIRSG